MVELSDIELGNTYRFVIQQRGEEYWADIEVDSTIENIVGTVQESNYPNEGWDGKFFKIDEEGEVTQSRGMFGPIGDVVSVESVE